MRCELRSFSKACFGWRPKAMARPPQKGSTYRRSEWVRKIGSICGSSQRFPPAHFKGGFSDLIFADGAGGETRTLMRSEPRQILSLVRIPISPLRPFFETAIDASRHIRGSQYGRQ